MRRIPPLAAVRVFEAAARHENFTAAAVELGMTQAAVSYQIKLLEERLGVPLFRREKKRVVLTEAGRRAAPQVGRAFDTLDLSVLRDGDVGHAQRRLHQQRLRLFDAPFGHQIDEGPARLLLDEMRQIVRR